MNRFPCSPQKGFIALISAIIISTILLALATTLGATTFFSRFDVLNSEYKRISLGLAEACVNQTLAKIGNDYDYAGNETVSLGTAYGAPLTCTIAPLAYVDASGKRTFSINTKANFYGAFSEVAVSATAQDPSVAPVSPPPTCTLVASPSSIPLGQSFQLLWSASANTTSMTIDHGVGSVNPLQTAAPWPSVTPTLVGTATYIATVSNAGGTNTCSATVTVTAPPPAPSCADSVMVFDRTGSMSGGDLSNERAAGNALIDLYAGVSSLPKVSVGSFGAYPNASLPAGAAGIPTNGQLSSAYTTLKSTLASITGSNSSVGSNLGAAISVGRAELASARHDSTKQKVFIFVSDGIPNEPTSGAAGDTGFILPSAAAQNGTGDAWTNPQGAYGNGATSDAGGHRERYSGFNWSIPSNATVTGLQVQATALSSASGGAPTTVTLPAATAVGNYDQWSTGGFGFPSKTSAVAANDGSSSYITETSVNQAETYIFPGAGIPAGATIDSVTLTATAATNGGNSTIALRAERGTGSGQQSDGPSVILTNTSYGPVTRTMATNPFTGAAWTLAEVNAWTTRFGVVRINSGGGSPRVTQLALSVTYRMPSTCTLGIDLSWNGGTTWSNEVTQPLTTATTTYTLTGSWGSHTWVPNDFSSTNFRARIHEVSAGPTCIVDTLGARVLYTTPTDPTQYALTAANAAKADGVNIFAIHFGDTSGQALMSQLASPSTVPQAQITTATRSGTTVTVTTSAAHRLTVNERVIISGVSSSALNGTFTVSAVVSPTSFRYTTSGSGTVSATGGSVQPTNLFIAPSSSAMTGIFQAIGTQVCPAAAPQCSDTIDNDGDGLIDENDPGCHTDGNAGNSGSYDPSGSDEWSAPPVPPPPPPPPPPPAITIGSWTEVP